MKKQSRENVLEALASAIDSIALPHTVRVGIDGMSASGKTRLADDLARTLRSDNRSVLRSGLDGFHNPAEIRHQRGPFSVQGYIEDSFDYPRVREQVLFPLGPNGNGHFRERNFDYKKDYKEKTSPVQVPKNSILLFEGVMLFNDQLIDYFDYRILVVCTEEEIIKRARVRDLEDFQSIELLEDKYFSRFLPGQRIHLANNRPQERADAILYNDDFFSPGLRFP